MTMKENELFSMKMECLFMHFYVGLWGKDSEMLLGQTMSDDNEELNVYGKPFASQVINLSSTKLIFDLDPIKHSTGQIMQMTLHITSALLSSLSRVDGTFSSTDKRPAINRSETFSTSRRRKTKETMRQSQP